MNHIETKSGLSVDERRILGRHAQYGLDDVYINEADSQFHPWIGNVWLKPLRFDVRNNTYVNIMWSKGAGHLGRHRHRGPVTGFTLEGSWGYREYDWVARTGDLINENPGVIHTLYSDTGCKVLFTLTASLEFYDDNDNLTQTMDTFSFLDLYINHCQATGTKVNEKLIF